MTYAVPGALLGLIVALLARHRIESSLYDVSAADPLTLAIATVLLLGVAALACWIPARRAAAADPVKAIRSD
jgi:ABC-type antimicrobial peptide transport system permease subunit